MAHRKLGIHTFHKTGMSILGALIVITVITAVWVLWRNSNQPPAYVGPTDHIRTGIVGEYSSLSIIAKQQGFFKKHGLDVTIKNYISGAPAVTDMLAGNVDVVTASDFVGVSNYFTHRNLRVLATQARADSFFLVVRTDHGLKSSIDLKGKRIGITRNTAGEFFLGQYLTLHYLKQSDVRLVSMPPDKLVEDLIAGSLDAIVTFDPHITEAQTKLKSAVSIWALPGNFAQLYGTSNLTSKRPQVVERYLRAMVEAEEYIQTHNDTARQIVGDFLHLDDAYMKRVWARITFSVSLDQDLLINMEDEARWSIENKLSSATTVPDYLQMIYFNGLERVKPDGITIIR